MNKAIAIPWLSLQCQMIPGVRHAVFAADLTFDNDFKTLETWPDGEESPVTVMSVLRTAIVSESVEIEHGKNQDGSDNLTNWIVACPLRRAGKVCGAVAVEVDGIDQSQVPVVSRLMQWGSAWPAFLADQNSAHHEHKPDSALELTKEVLEAETLSVATANIATKLAQIHEADRVAIGLLQGSSMHAIALSGRAVFDRRNDSVRMIEAAQEEALDQGTTVMWPALSDSTGVINTSHAQLSKDDQCSCTVLLRARGKVTGAVTICRARGNAFTDAHIESFEALATSLGTALHCRGRADQSASARMVETAKTFATRLVGAGHVGMKVGTIAGATLLLFLALATTAYEVSAPAVLEGRVERDLAAPVNGFIADAFVRAGERVKAGDVLATLDDSDMQLERSRLEGLHAELTNEYHRALGALDHGATRVLTAQLSQAQSQLELIQDQLARTRIVAPFDALVVDGDLSQSLGSPVTRGDPLFRLAPEDGYRVILEVDENDVSGIKPGADGRLVLTSMPGQQYAVKVERMNGMTHRADGRNVLEIEAQLVGDPIHLRPGMKGFARVDVGREKLLWIWTHRARERLRMWWWAVGPVA